MESGHNAQVAQGVQARERRRSSISLAIPVCAHQMTASVEIRNDEVEFEAHGVKISHEGLFIEGTNVSEIHQDDLRVLRELGRGACSVVKQAQHVETRELYAIKVFSVFDKDKRSQLLKEVETLSSMECPSLINFDGSIHVVLEYMDRGSLSDVIHGWRGMDYGEDLMAAITLQARPWILWGLGYLHYEHHVHRDVKPQNVLLNSHGEVKLSDFGIARELQGEMDLAQTMVGTIRYMSPERLAGDGYGVAADVWSLGVLLLEMAARRLPFESAVSQIELHDRLQQDLAVDDLIKLVPGHSPQFEQVLRGCLQPIPEERLTPAELLELDWFLRFREPQPPVVLEESGGGGTGGERSSAGGTGGGGISEGGGDGGGELQPVRGDVAEAGEEEEADGHSDLDLAAHVVREFMVRAVESGELVGEVNGGGRGGGGGGGVSQQREEQHRRGSSGGGMIQTMRSDGDLSDSDGQSQGEFESDPKEDFGGFAGFHREGQDALEHTG
ncbi:unnamed protein product [Ectocarpus sp. 6 AP-2014]